MKNMSGEWGLYGPRRRDERLTFCLVWVGIYRNRCSPALDEVEEEEKGMDDRKSPQIALAAREKCAKSQTNQNLKPLSVAYHWFVKHGSHDGYPYVHTGV